MRSQKYAAIWRTNKSIIPRLVLAGCWTSSARRVDSLLLLELCYLDIASTHGLSNPFVVTHKALQSTIYNGPYNNGHFVSQINKPSHINIATRPDRNDSDDMIDDDDSFMLNTMMAKITRRHRRHTTHIILYFAHRDMFFYWSGHF